MSAFPETTPDIASLYLDTETLDSPIEVIALASDDAGITAVLHAETGEVLDLPDAPRLSDGQLMTRGDVEYYAERRLRAMGRIATAEKARAEKLAFWTARINAEFEWDIRRDKSLIAWLDGRYFAALETFAAAAIVGAKRKSVEICGLILKFGRTGGGTVIVNEAAAIAWAKTHCPGAIKQTESILKTPLKDELGADFDYPADSGIVRVPVTQKFKVE